MKCPYCAEEIQAEARICRYCHERLDGVAESRPRAAAYHRREDGRPPANVGGVPGSISRLLAPDEYVVYKGSESFWKTGRLSSETLFVTNRRIFTCIPKNLGLRSDVEAVDIADIANVRLQKGLFNSTLTIYLRFTEEEYELPNIPTGDAERLYQAIMALLSHGGGGKTFRR